MDKVFKRINKLIVDNQEVVLDEPSFKVVTAFAKFLQEWERGFFEAEIVSHKDNRYIYFKVTDVDRIDLPAKNKKVI